MAARGLDVTDLTHIINYNLPDEPEVYIHRSGRTGRAGKTGISIAIIHTREMGRIKEIERKGGISFKCESIPKGIDICQKRLYSLIDKIENIKTATLWKKNKSTFEPDYCAVRLSDNPWIVQPFEVYEEIRIEDIKKKHNK